MPVMDGIKLSENILAKYPQIKIIILSGYDDFEYAKKSISVGVREYILKPIDSTELTNSLLTQVNDIDKEEELRDKMNFMEPYLKERILNDLLFSSVEKDELYKYGLSFKSNMFRLALCRVDRGLDGIYKSRQYVIDTINNYFIDKSDSYCFWASGGYIVLLFHNKHSELENLCQRVINNINRRFNISLTIGISQTLIGIDNISSLYKQSKRGLESRIIGDKNSVILYDDTVALWGYDPIKSNTLLKEFSLSLKSGLLENCKKQIEDLFNLQIMGVGGDLNSLRILSSNIIFIVLQVISDHGIEIESIFGQNKQPYHNLYRLNNIGDINEYLFSLCHKITYEIKDKNCKSCNLLISNVKKFIKENMQDPDLQLTIVAENFHINPSYLSRKFKSECGISFIDFLARLRLEKAIELVQNSDKRSYEIAEEIGISDPHYFSIFFKKKMKMSLSEYKKTLKVK